MQSHMVNAPYFRFIACNSEYDRHISGKEGTIILYFFAVVIRYPNLNTLFEINDSRVLI
ncbi:hypothetical protein BH23THE1_BH23THE1_08970 [soil metagenome]